MINGVPHIPKMSKEGARISEAVASKILKEAGLAKPGPVHLRGHAVAEETLESTSQAGSTIDVVIADQIGDASTSRRQPNRRRGGPNGGDDDDGTGAKREGRTTVDVGRDMVCETALCR